MALSAQPKRHDEDARLVADFRAGDDLAFEAIVARHRPRLLAFARSILRRAPDTAEDVVQEALIRAHRALLRDDRPVMLGPWLAKLTRNCALDEISGAVRDRDTERFAPLRLITNSHCCSHSAAAWRLRRLEAVPLAASESISLRCRPRSRSKRSSSAARAMRVDGACLLCSQRFPAPRKSSTAASASVPMISARE